MSLQLQRRRSTAQRLILEITPNIPIHLVSIPGGPFLMGSPDDELDRFSDEGPQHEVTIAPFFMGMYPVTQAQWRAVSTLPEINLTLKPEPSNFKGDNLPVEQVSWLEATEFCDRLSIHTDRKIALPSEAQWEYACRAGTTTPFHFGETIDSTIANYCAIDRKIEENQYFGKYGDGKLGKYLKKTDRKSVV